MEQIVWQCWPIVATILLDKNKWKQVRCRHSKQFIIVESSGFCLYHHLYALHLFQIKFWLYIFISIVQFLKFDWTYLLKSLIFIVRAWECWEKKKKKCNCQVVVSSYSECLNMMVNIHFKLMSCWIFTFTIFLILLPTFLRSS